MIMTRVTSPLALLLVAVLAFVHVDAAAFSIGLSSPKVALTKGPLQLELLVTPPQPELAELTIDAIVDTTGKNVATDVKVVGTGGKYVAKLDTKLDAGLYKMKVSANDVYEVVAFKVTLPVEVASAKVNGVELAKGDKLKKQLFSSGSGDALKLDVKLQNKLDKSSATAHQTFLRFTHVEDKVETYFVLTLDGAKKTYSTTLNFAALSKKFSYKSGDHKVQLIIGDATFEQGIVLDLGTVELLLGAAPPVAPSPLYAKALLHDSDTTLKALPEIKHMMRPQDPRPLVVVSLAFAGGVLVPLFAFLIFVLKLQLNISKLFSGSVFIFGTGFLASLAAILALFAWYWIELTMFQTLGYLAVVGAVNLLFGLFTLKPLAQSSLTSGKKSKLE